MGPEQCREPQELMVLTVIYYIVFVVLAAQVLLTLFIGVISASMEEARAAKALEMATEEEIALYAAQRGLTEIQTTAFSEVFELLDLDGGGIISDKELRLGLQSIHMDLSNEEIAELTDRIDPDNKGINVVGFMKFFFMTPKYKDGAAEAEQRYLVKLKETRMHKKRTLMDRFWRWLVKTFPQLDSNDDDLRHEAALVLQDVWRARQARRKALAEIEWKRRELAQTEDNRIPDGLTKMEEEYTEQAEMGKKHEEGIPNDVHDASIGSDVELARLNEINSMIPDMDETEVTMTNTSN